VSAGEQGGAVLLRKAVPERVDRTGQSRHGFEPYRSIRS
jgi:hypothetical protein